MCPGSPECSGSYQTLLGAAVGNIDFLVCWLDSQGGVAVVAGGTAVFVGVMFAAADTVSEFLQEDNKTGLHYRTSALVPVLVDSDSRVDAAVAVDCLPGGHADPDSLDAPSSPLALDLALDAPGEPSRSIEHSGYPHTPSGQDYKQCLASSSHPIYMMSLASYHSIDDS